MRVPSTDPYATATAMASEGSVSRQQALWAWLDVKPPRRRALQLCDPLRPMVVYRGGPKRRTLDAMVKDGLLYTVAHVKGAWYLTGWGLMVREAGTRSPKETS